MNMYFIIICPYKKPMIRTCIDICGYKQTYHFEGFLVNTKVVYVAGQVNSGSRPSAIDLVSLMPACHGVAPGTVQTDWPY